MSTPKPVFIAAVAAALALPPSALAAPASAATALALAGAAVATPALPAALTPAPAAEEGGVKWFEGTYNGALATAREQETLVLIAFVPDWSEYSRRMLDEVYADSDVGELLGEMVCVKYEGDDLHSRQVSKIYNIETYPSIVFARADGQVEDVIFGFIPIDPLFGEVERIRGGENTVSMFEQVVAEDPDDLERRYALYEKLNNVLAYGRAAEQLDAIRTADPEGETVVGSRLKTQEIWDTIQAASDDPERWDLAPLFTHLESLELDAARFEGWAGLGNFHASYGRMAASRDAFAKAWAHVPDDQVMGWGFNVANWIMENDEGDLSLEHQGFVIELSEKAAARAIALGEPDDEGNPAETGDDYAEWLANRLDQVVRCKFLYGADDERLLAQALETCRRTIELAPENPEYRNRLVMLQARLEPQG